MHSCEDDEFINNLELRKRAQKRRSSIDEIISKRRRIQNNPIFSYAHSPPLNRWLLELKKSKNKNSIKRVLNNIPLTPRYKSIQPRTIQTRKNRRDQLYEPYEKEMINLKPTPHVKLTRLPENLTDEVINSLIKDYNTNKKINSKWESIPKIKTTSRKQK